MLFKERAPIPRKMYRILLVPAPSNQNYLFNMWRESQSTSVRTDEVRKFGRATDKYAYSSTGTLTLSIFPLFSASSNLFRLQSKNLTVKEFRLTNSTAL
jgi:hypothetical protein